MVIIMSDIKNSVPKKIETPYLKVEKNCLEIEGICIQLSNISILSTTDVASPDIWKLVIPIIAIILGFMALPVGLLVIIPCAVLVYLWVRNYKKSKEAKCLNIVTNSGNIFPIVFETQEFLEKVMSIMVDIMREPNNEESAVFDLRNSTITECSIGGNTTNITLS